jgi:hypothetical protein
MAAPPVAQATDFPSLEIFHVSTPLPVVNDKPASILRITTNIMALGLATTICETSLSSCRLHWQAC